MWPGDVFSKYPNVMNICELRALGIHPDYQGRGLATKLVQQTLMVAQKVLGPYLVGTQLLPE